MRVTGLATSKLLEYLITRDAKFGRYRGQSGAALSFSAPIVRMASASVIDFLDYS